MAEIYFSVDIEADGPYPAIYDGYSMSSFGVVACAVQENDGTVRNLDIDAFGNRWYSELQPISENVDEEAAAVSGLDREHLLAYGDEPRPAMVAFNTWVKTVSNRNNATPVFVAWPAPFDWFWMYWYLMVFAGQSAFGFSSAVNMKDVYAVKAGIPFKKVGKRKVYSHLGITARPHTHNALDDATEQAELWQAILAMETKR